MLEFQAQPAGAPGSSFVWDVANPGRPEAELAPASPLVCLAFNLKARLRRRERSACVIELCLLWQPRTAAHPKAQMANAELPEELQAFSTGLGP